MKQLINFTKKICTDFIFSNICCFCQNDYYLEDEKICASCQSQLHFISEPFCNICGKPFINKLDKSHTCGECLKEKKHYSKARSIFVYDDLIQSEIINYKFNRDIRLAMVFSVYMLEYIEKKLNNQYDVIIPVPLHKKRLQERYFNQALLLVENAPKINKIKVDKWSLERIKYTLPQLSLKYKERAENIKGAFRVGEGNVANILDKRILLVDDIYTTGSTVNECSLALKKAGAMQVDVLTLAKVVQNENI